MRGVRGAAVAIALSVALTGCQVAASDPVVPSAPVVAESPASASPSGSPATPGPSASATSATAAPTPTMSPTQDALPLAGRTIVIDPGHNGVWTKRELRKVPSGNGRSKECNSSGTATNAGYAEHAYNWAQANALAKELRARGATVRLTRPNDHGEGPCVNLRSALANELKADALVSIHADGSFASGARGFHVIVSTTMVGGSAVEKESTALAKRLRRALETETAMPRSTYIGGGTALSFRNDLGTLNLSKRTAVMLEMGNMRHATDAALLGSAKFRTQAARAIADGLEAYLG
ncbi:MAG: N-acetylmuramoyl-L-alanine amidase [Propionicimonas sp.]|uniref:N-acetylmuramoyl-L-alanine amidase n=1 Tax=Propionicimonas sp. TaxID=1955623 RepID=UPI003D09B5F1